MECFLYSSLYGYGHLDTFQDITDEDIELVENNARTQLVTILQKKARDDGVEVDDNLKTAFYGIFAASPEDFEIVPGDKKFIKKLVVRVRERMMSSEEYFEVKEQPRKKPRLVLDETVESIFGLIYGQKTQFKKIGTEISNESLKKKLFIAAKSVFELFSEELLMRDCSNLSIEMIEVTCDENRINGSIMCIICQKRQKVFFKTGQRSNSWVLANLRKHIKVCLKFEHKKQISLDSALPINENNATYEDNSNDTVIELNISKLDSADEDLQSQLEDLIATQMTIQNVKIMNIVFQRKEEEQKMYCDFGSKSRKQSIKLCDVEDDGSCLFYAISHQLMQPKLMSTEHKTYAADLRQSVVEHIESNLPKYLHDLKNRLICQKLMNDQESLEEQCSNFVKNYLAKPNTFGGTESIEAISTIKQVNIIVFNEKGTCYFGAKFNPTYKNIIMIAFRGLEGQNNENRNHFGSVTEITPNIISAVSQHLIGNYMQYIRNKSRTSIVELE